MPDPSSLGPAPIPTAPTNRIMDRTLSPPRPTFRTTAILPSTHLPGSSSHQPVTAAPRCPAPSVLRRCSSLILTLYSDHQPYHSARPSPQRRLRFLPRRGRTARHRRPVMWHHAGYAGAAGPDGALEAFREHKFESERRDHGYWHWRHLARRGTRSCATQALGTRTLVVMRYVCDTDFATARPRRRRRRRLRRRALPPPTRQSRRRARTAFAARAGHHPIRPTQRARRAVLRPAPHLGPARCRARHGARARTLRSQSQLDTQLRAATSRSLTARRRPTLRRSCPPRRRPATPRPAT